MSTEKKALVIMLFLADCGIYINDDFIKDGLFNASAARPLVRLGYMDYGVVALKTLF